MPNLVLPNDLANGTDADATKLQQNFDEVEAWANAEAIRRDGAVAFTAVQAGVTPTATNHLATKGYVDSTGLTGEIRMYGGDAAPTGWLFCRGQAVSRATYAALFTVLGTKFGVGDGATTFNLPDFRARGAIGHNPPAAPVTIEGRTDLWSNPVGEKAGVAATRVAAHTHTIDHNHGSVSTSTTGEHDHGMVPNAPLISALGGTNVIDAFDGGSAYATDVNTFDVEGNHAHTVDLPNFAGSSGSAGTTSFTGNYHPGLSVNFIVKHGGA